MRRREDFTLLIAGILVVLVAALLMTFSPDFVPSPRLQPTEAPQTETGLLTDPFLQNPTETSVRVVWFTEFEGQEHRVIYGQPGQALDQGPTDQLSQVTATTTLLTRTREDGDSNWLPANGQPLKAPIRRPIWRHEAEVVGLTAGERVPYQVVSIREDGQPFQSSTYSLAPTPTNGQSLKILLTSDHQQKPMTAANLQKVQEAIGQVDAVFMAGDLVDIPDRASEWFDDSLGNAFFPCLQGRADFNLEREGQTTRYRGGAIIQHAPLFPTIGNHEVMGRYSSNGSLKSQFDDPVPRSAAIKTYEDYQPLFNPNNDEGLRRFWVVNHSFNSETYEEIFSLPETVVPNPDRPETTSRYYAVTFGDIRLVSLYVTQIWRRPTVDPTIQGRYQEKEQDLGTPQNWGHGQHIFEPIVQGSLQYQWLAAELASPEFRQAKYKIVMFHHPPHSLGDNIVPAFTDPVPVYDRRPDGSLKAVRYEYPLQQDHITRDLVPLLEQAGVNLVLYGHSHLWNRFVSPGGVHYLETSNVGNTYGAYWKDQTRPVPPTEANPPFEGYQSQYYVAQGDPNGLEPVIPTLAPLLGPLGQPQPYIASNDITVFTILDTGNGRVSSYYFDTRKPNSEVIKFDEFSLGSAFIS